MIDALIAGRLYGKAQPRTDKNGKLYCTAKVRVATGNGESCFVNVIAFAAPAVEALLALTDGDSVALAGELAPKVWTDKDGTAHPSLDLVAHQTLTQFHVGRKRKAMQQGGEPAPLPAADLLDEPLPSFSRGAT